MYRPYNDIVESDAPIPGDRNRSREPGRLDPGDIAYWPLTETVPASYDQITSLYIIGYVEYSDRLKTHRGVYFARRYDPTDRRFAPVKDNPDYESEE
jgi:hypothetical protein